MVKTYVPVRCIEFKESSGGGWIRVEDYESLEQQVRELTEAAYEVVSLRQQVQALERSYADLDQLFVAMRDSKREKGQQVQVLQTGIQSAIYAITCPVSGSEDGGLKVLRELLVEQQGGQAGE